MLTMSISGQRKSFISDLIGFDVIDEMNFRCQEIGDSWLRRTAMVRWRARPLVGQEDVSGRDGWRTNAAMLAGTGGARPSDCRIA
jgi:hypothetical protein